uniref:Uncharacterized protein n=1 Tax=Anguilla anguilla TaxID=7936 RepID=A0A0E9QK36_ANGAN
MVKRSFPATEEPRAGPSSGPRPRPTLTSATSAIAEAPEVVA